MKFKLSMFCLVTIFILSGFQSNENPDYIEYHKKITEAEILLSEEAFGDALIRYEQVFELYDFIFLRDYKVAS